MMDNIHEIIPFAKEMLNAKSAKGSLKVYLVGGTFALLGVVSGIVEATCSLFPNNEADEDEELMKALVSERQQKLEPQTIVPDPEELDELDAETEAKAKQITAGRQRRMSFRSHAS